MTIRNRGTLTVNVGNASSGIDLATAATLTITTGGAIQLTFTAAPADASQGHWGLRWGGTDKEAALNAMMAGASPLIVVNDDAVGNKVQVYTCKGDTYVGIPPHRGTLILLR